jgi:hypothetical protein
VPSSDLIVLRAALRRRLGLLLLLAAAGCQPLPHPFAGDRPPPSSPILSPPDSAGVSVGPVEGAPPAAAAQLAEAMAAALREADVPASTQGRNKQSYRLTGTARTAAPEAEASPVTIDWDLRNAAGETIGRHSETVPQAAGWRDGGEALAKMVAMRSAPAIAKLVEGESAPMVAGVDPLVAIRPVSGAPGDGSNALPRAMAEALRRANIPVVDKPDDKENFVLAGTVQMSPPRGGKQQVKVTWNLLRRDGSQIGQISQENAIPAGSLDGSWGDIAYAVASAAAQGVTALIERAKTAAVEGPDRAISR